MTYIEVNLFFRIIQLIKSMIQSSHWSIDSISNLVLKTLIIARTSSTINWCAPPRLQVYCRHSIVRRRATMPTLVLSLNCHHSFPSILIPSQLQNPNFSSLEFKSNQHHTSISHTLFKTPRYSSSIVHAVNEDSNPETVQGKGNTLFFACINAN